MVVYCLQCTLLPLSREKRQSVIIRGKSDLASLREEENIT